MLQLIVKGTKADVERECLVRNIAPLMIETVRQGSRFVENQRVIVFEHHQVVVMRWLNEEIKDEAGAYVPGTLLHFRIIHSAEELSCGQ